MKKWLCLLMTLAMMLGCCAAVGEEADWITIGQGDKDVLVLVKVLEKYVYGYELKTSESNLLDALLDIGLVTGEKASWGFNITRVDGFKGIPEENGAYWTIQVYNDEKERFQKLDTAIGDVGTEDYTAIALVRNTDDVPYEEKLIYMVVDDGSGELSAFEILTENQDSVLDCLLENGLVGGETESWGFNVTEAAGVKANYDRDGTYFNILEYNDDTQSFEHMERSLASIGIDELPSFPEMAGYAFILSK